MKYLPILLLLVFFTACQYVSFPSLKTSKEKNKPKIKEKPQTQKIPEKDEQTKSETKPDTKTRKTEKGMASYYGDKLHGNKTASGVPYDKNKKTAAHLTLPFGTKVEVRNVRTGQKTVVVINDRGPYKKMRIIDVSGAAAKELGMIQAGVVEVEITILDR